MAESMGGILPDRNSKKCRKIHRITSVPPVIILLKNPFSTGILQHRCFLVNLDKIFQLFFKQNTSEWLFLQNECLATASCFKSLKKMQ